MVVMESRLLDTMRGYMVNKEAKRLKNGAGDYVYEGDVVIRKEKDIPFKELGQYIPLKQWHLSRVTGLTESAISDLCRLRRTVANIEHLTKIANALEIEDVRLLMDFRIVN